MSFPQKQVDLLNWYWFEHGFSIDEINKVHQLAEKFRWEDAVVLGSDSPKEEIRKSRIKWLMNTDRDAKWLYDKLLELVRISNSELWNFDLISSGESVQYT